MTEEWQNEVTQKLQNGDIRMTAMEASLKANTDVTASMARDMETIREVLQAGKAGLKVLAALGSIARWLAPIITVGGLIWAIIHGKFPGDSISKG